MSESKAGESTPHNKQVSPYQLLKPGEPITASRSLSLPTNHPDNRAFLTRLAQLTPSSEPPQRWLYVPYDQLSLELEPLGEGVDQGANEWGLVLIESGAWLRVRPYHKQRVGALILNQRAFALEAAERGFHVQYHLHEESLEERLAEVIQALPLPSVHRKISVREPAERALRVALTPLLAQGLLEVRPHTGWLSTPQDFERGAGEAPPWRMDRFYRYMRKKSGLLMEKGKPVGGKWSYDAHNREPWRGEPPAPSLPRFEEPHRASLRAEVRRWLEDAYSDHPGTLDLSLIPGALSEHEALWAWAKEQCLPTFGPYEDAMSATEPTLFHTRLSLSINLHRLLSSRLLAELPVLKLPLASEEGFVRQILGWREFVRHVHLRTEGHRLGLKGPSALAPTLGDAGYAQWRACERKGEAQWTSRGWREGEAEARAQGWRPTLQSVEDGGAQPQKSQAGEQVGLSASLEPSELPPVFWGAPSGLRCLDSVVADVWREGWSHHITRLMVLSNWATLLGLSPRALTDWFWVAYIDAFDWVVEPNVLGMSTFAVGPLMTTKPYVSGAAYVNKMSDYCEGCSFSPHTKPKRGDTRPLCPMTSAYWDTLRRNAALLAGNPRLSMPLASERKRSEAQREADQARTTALRVALMAGERVTPDDGSSQPSPTPLF